MSRPRLLTPTVIALAAILVAAGTAIVVVLTVPVDAPQVLAVPTPATVVTATQRSDADERQVQLVLETGAPRAVVTTRSGTVTAFTCTTGGTVRSGDVVAAVDGRPVVAMATSVPLWRDLALDDRGDDVRALQSELARLGSRIVADGIVGPSTIRAARTFLVQHGVAKADLAADAVPIAAFAWIPAPETTVRSCAAVVGAPVPDDGVLVSLPAELRSARLEQTPTDAVAGARQVDVSSTTIDIGADGIIADDTGLRAIESLAEYQSTIASADGVPTLIATWSLAEPIDVDVLPPTALWDVVDGTACVQPTEGDARRVDVVGSELGQAFVRAPAGARLERVEAEPDRTRGCQ